MCARWEKFILCICIGLLGLVYWKAFTIRERKANSEVRAIQDIKASTVLINSKHGCGSGVILKDGKHVLTVAHIIDTSEVYVKVDDTSAKRSAKLTDIDIVKDIALLELNKEVVDPVQVTFIEGYPDTNLLNKATPNLMCARGYESFVKGYVSKPTIKGFNNEIYTQIIGAYYPGASGSPVFGDSGCIGLVRATYTNNDNIAILIPSVMIRDWLISIDKEHLL